MKGIYWLAVFGITSLQALSINPSLAQSSNIIPDNSLGAESSQVIENFQGLPVEVILGGAEQRSNLLSVNPSALFFNAVNSQGQIVNRSRATSTVLGTPVNGLRLYVKIT